MIFTVAIVQCISEHGHIQLRTVQFCGLLDNSVGRKDIFLDSMRHNLTLIQAAGGVDDFWNFEQV